MSLNILRTGPMALLQDKGRFGYQSIGVTPGGPMDEHAFDWANKLLNNDPNATQIEITLGQFSCTFKSDTIIALAGADMGAMLNGNPVNSWQTYAIKAGDKLSMKFAKSGLRSYLAVLGGFQVETVLGSSATVVRDGLGGNYGNGAALQADVEVQYFPLTEIQSISANKFPPHKKVPDRFIPAYERHVEIGVIPSYQFDEFSKEERQRFFSSIYTVSPNIDRMGYRLSGEPIQCERSNLISEGIALGAIQIPSDGQPIVLMRDRQTIGGYPKIGCVIHADISRLAQCLPGYTVQFYKKNIYSSESELLIQRNFFASNNA